MMLPHATDNCSAEAQGQSGSDGPIARRPWHSRFLPEPVLLVVRGHGDAVDRESERCLVKRFLWSQCYSNHTPVARRRISIIAVTWADTASYCGSDYAAGCLTTRGVIRSTVVSGIGLLRGLFDTAAKDSNPSRRR